MQNRVLIRNLFYYILFFKGNKNDLNSSREIPFYVGESFAQRHNMKFIETSAKDSDNVDKIFYEIADLLTKQANELYPPKSSGNRILLESTPQTNSIGGCCST